MRLTVFAAMIVGSVTVQVSSARACSCNMPDANTARERSAAVFEGRVVSVQTEGDSLTATLRVTQAWKGVDTEEVVVTTIAHESMCGVPFSEGTVWLVYGDGSGERFETGLCNRTRLRSDAEEDVQAFGAGVTPVDPSGPSPLDEEEEEEPVEAPGSRGGCASCATSEPTTDGAWMLIVLVVLRKRAAVLRRG